MSNGEGSPAEVVLQTDARRPEAKHAILELYAEHGVALMEIARWLLDQGMDPSAPAAVGPSGFGGYTALFNTMVSLPNFWMNHRKRGPFIAPFTELLLERGAVPNVRASLWKRLGPGHDDTMTRHDYRDVTALSWGRRFHDPIFVSEPAMRLIEEAGGVE